MDRTPDAELGDVLKRYRGRPTKYKPKFCDAVIAWGMIGKSRTWMAAEMMVARQTLDDWAKANSEFSDALTLAKQLEQLWWEDKGQDCLLHSNFQGAMWSRSMAARFPKEWRQNTQVDHGVAGDLLAFLHEIDGDSASLI